jgi:hypothetical protein
MAAVAEEVLRERWMSWVQGALGGTRAQIDAATEAVMDAIRAGATQGQAEARARAAWIAAQGVAVAPLPTGGPAAPPAAQPSAPPAAGAPGAMLTGRVAGFQQRNEQVGQRYVAVWNFRVEGDGGPAVAVEMRGYSFEGSIGEGDEVRIDAHARGGDVVHVGRLENLTSNSIVRITSRPHPVVRGFGLATRFVLRLVFLLIVLAVIAAAVVFIVNHGNP